MALSASDQAALQQMALGLQGASNIPWSTLLGSVTLGTPAPGTATLPAEEAAGLMTNAPFAGDLTAQMQTATGYTNPYINEMGNLGNAYSGPQETLQGTEANQAASGWITPPGTPPPGAVRFGQTGDGVWAWMDAGDHVIGPTYATQQGGPTMSNQQAFANEFGAMGAFGANANGSQAGQTANGFTNPYTLAAQEEMGAIGGHLDPTTGLYVGGNSTLAAQKQQADIATAIADLIGKYSGGPADAFKQQAVLHGLDASGMSNAVDAISGKYGLPNFAAPQANPQARSLVSLLQQANGTNGGGVGGGSSWTGQTAQQGGPLYAAPDGTGSTLNPADGGTTVIGGTHYHLATNAAGAPSTLDPTSAAYVNALPAPNKINGPAWMQLDPDTKSFLLGAYNQAGDSNNDISNAVTQGLPQFKAPDAGSVAPSGQLAG